MISIAINKIKIHHWQEQQQPQQKWRKKNSKEKAWGFIKQYIKCKRTLYMIVNHVLTMNCRRSQTFLDWWNWSEWAKKSPERWRIEADNVEKCCPVDLRNLFNYGVKSIQWHSWNMYVANQYRWERKRESAQRRRERTACDCKLVRVKAKTFKKPKTNRTETQAAMCIWRSNMIEKCSSSLFFPFLILIVFLVSYYEATTLPLILTSQFFLLC